MPRPYYSGVVRSAQGRWCDFGLSIIAPGDRLERDQGPRGTPGATIPGLYGAPRSDGVISVCQLLPPRSGREAGGEVFLSSRSVPEAGGEVFLNSPERAGGGHPIFETSI